MELKQEELDKILAGNLQGMSEESAINNPNLFREKQIEELRKEKEIIESMQDNVLEDNSKVK